ncbi:putative MT-associated protein TORTIFOLIA1/SPIRAL2 [Helianthus annuus]|nr:putative MT-associated protein TORTIFOLIA1/SPIRAL2 [Helianthus annuus]KAJ0554784.1 putative MT-associated protein TORTIFOLIA1/SPIRAL2 [Helianthus annuus]KAJ0720352.1 putative MT-associated protein TORTIFOLIA1/SPIRAL2 [Helianthus annuus]
MSLAKHTPSKHTPRSPPDFKHRVLTCLNKLSDRDTHSAAATELESIAKTLNHDSISPFLSSISTTNSSDKSPVRKQCIRLISTLSETHGNILSPHLSKLLSAVVRRLRDPDTVVRTACVAATASIAAHVTKPPFISVAEDWAVRKGAAEVLEVLAVVEKDLLPEYKASCLKTFEAKKFDKVKGVRETMNQMIEAWNAVLDVPEEVLQQQESHSSKEEEAEIQNPPQITKRTVPSGSGSATSRKTGPAMFRKLDRKKPNDQKLNTTEGQHSKQRSLKQETKRALFSEITDEKIPESQSHEDMERSGIAGSLNIDSVHQDEDMSLIRNQLVQIETQQSNLFDLLEKYIGSSQDGMRSLESRVRGLESTLDEISYDLAKSTGQGSNPKPTLCCRLPGADLLSSKLWKKSEIQPSNTRYASSSSSSSVKKTNHGSYNVGGGSGLIKNPLAEVRQM